MSAPTPAPGDERPREGYYPDPSIPGYVRYWNGASWVPGTSRPAPQQGETTPERPPPGSGGPGPGEESGPRLAEQRPGPGPVDETGPMFFDEPGEAAANRQEPAANRQEPAAAWQADASQQTGFGGDRDRRVSWGGPDAPDPRTPAGSAPPAGAPGSVVPAGRAPVDPRRPAPQDPTAGALPGMRDGSGGVTDGTVAIRVNRPRRPGSGGGDAAAPPSDGTMTIRSTGPGGATPQAPSPAGSPNPQQAQHAQAPAQQDQPPAPAAQGPVLNTPLTPGPGGGSASWAQQVHQLAQPGQTAPPQREQYRPGAQQQRPQYQQQRPVPAQQQGGGPDQPVVPWKPPVDDPFQQLARAQSSARPAGLGKRLVARLLDTLVLGAFVGAVGFPLVTQAMDHIDAKIQAAKQSGETVTVWLLDATTAGLLGAVLGAFLVLGFVLEALPTAKWGRTLGKRLCGLDVRDIESHGPPTIGAALRRWLVYGVLGIAVIGVVNVLWCVFDRPWRQCWHDKAARTFVAG